jgi:hypothetical protein
MNTNLLLFLLFLIFTRFVESRFALVFVRHFAPVLVLLALFLEVGEELRWHLAFGHQTGYCEGRLELLLLAATLHQLVRLEVDENQKDDSFAAAEQY